MLPLRRRIKLCGKFADLAGGVVLLLMGVVAAAGLMGCGTAVTLQTGTYAVDVTATSGALSHTATATLTVQ
jgi:hypothetical protein